MTSQHPANEPTVLGADPAALPADLLAFRVECEVRVCTSTATHALVFQAGCRCQDRRGSWLLCLPHVERGLRELRERFAWRCDRCGLVGYWCTPLRVEILR